MTLSPKKAFDPTVNFTIFGSWVKTMETLETKDDQNCQAYRLFKAIANYSMYDEQPNFGDNIAMCAIWPLIEREIDNSLRRRRSNFAKDTINENHQRIIAALKACPGSSYSKIAEQTGTNKSMVARVKRKYADTISPAVDAPTEEDGNTVGVGTDTGTIVHPDTIRRNSNNGADDPFVELEDDDGELPF